MMRISRLGSWLFVGLILIGASGCDNVDWGGTNVAVVPPPPKAAAGEDAAQQTDMGPLPNGPVIYRVRADSANGVITPIAEVVGDSLAPLGMGADADLYGSRFISEHMRRGSEFTLFRNGARVGTLVVQSAEVPRAAMCRRLPRARGTLELAGTTSGGGEFLAMSKRSAPDAEPPTFSMQPTPGMRRVMPILAERALRARQSQLPGNWQAAMVQVQPFPVSRSGDAAIASTFLVDDQLQVGNDDTGYSLFLVAVPRRDLTGYDTTYVEYSSYPETGKRAPRVVDFLDWDRDGDAELLLEVYGTKRSWFESVGTVDEKWRRIFAEQCDVEEPATPDTTAASAAAATRDTIRSGGE